ncbi:MetQ/NlpA family ABC transporter substrate-binding protein [Enterococcus dongliensis]|uniref:Lipoprotein n=1 Tax=Enterococcus dongliensis TaxID=2559925 RepID=A0AAW8TKH9_9ENTE|nr:MetQ/NlpA family ABC transporter substrate-binding protein [Enterococcus dongliensis]MDT2596695.1 MetQ/NlpA family ABC transporter substrate-binding protein [Enterococcus dongliensis]MDT2604222.1 MetQ/NlpA family ABC transporter substrate-binding protein [Enterococcus dongliensis]MDT2614347.1 MetQ/NlpA family ABC transporter substrate-binding protein [Enterococcus dongliensis]MDT2634586.1 MetQ/NlpA family ABC transporter substrate-binding protein [Enterococcus dongliensis]MDT2637590.1 MetQ/
MKKLFALLGVVVVLIAAGFGIHQVSSQSQKKESKTIIVGSQGSDFQIWQHIASSPEAKKAGLKIQVKEITDGVQLNKATADGSVDVNAFQSYSYFKAFNQENKKNQLVNLGTTYLEPLGIYSEKVQSLEELPDQATVAIANNPANTARGLLLLQEAGLIKLSDDFGPLSGVEEVAENPKHLVFKQIDDTTGPRVLKSVDAVLISNTVALDGGLNVLDDSLFHEKVDQSTKNNINILATAKSNEKNGNFKKLVKLYHNKTIQDYIEKEYNGTKIEVVKSLSYLEK